MQTAIAQRSTYASNQIGTPPPDSVFQQREDALKKAEELYRQGQTPVQKPTDKKRQLDQIVFQQGKNNPIYKQISGASEGRSLNGETPQDGSNPLNSTPTPVGSSVSETQIQQLNKEGVEPIQSRAEAQPDTEYQSQSDRALAILRQVAAVIFGQMDGKASLETALLKKKDEISAAQHEMNEKIFSICGEGISGATQLTGGAVGLGISCRTGTGKVEKEGEDGEDGASSTKKKDTTEPGTVTKLQDTVANETSETSAELAQNNVSKEQEKGEARKKENQEQESEIVRDGDERRQARRSEEQQDAQDVQPPDASTEEPKKDDPKKEEPKKKKEKAPFNHDAFHSIYTGSAGVLKSAITAGGLPEGQQAAIDRANVSMDDTIARQQADLQDQRTKLMDANAQAQKELSDSSSKTGVAITAR